VKTSYEIDQEYGVHSAQIGQWKKAIQEQAKTLFEGKRGPKPVDESDLLIARLIDEEYTRHHSMAAGEWLYSRESGPYRQSQAGYNGWHDKWGCPAWPPGHAFDNIFVERLWRNIKHEDTYLEGLWLDS